MPKNEVLIASAGSRKTSFLVETALGLPGSRALMTTYTRENSGQISRYIVERHGCVPSWITPLTWFSFLLQDGVRPYQRALTGSVRVRSIAFGRLSEAARFIKRSTNPVGYYLTADNDIYQDRVAEFVVRANEATNGAVIKRLSAVYDHVFIDELQDLSAYDLNFIDLLFDADIAVTIVGDPRQGTFSTTGANKNKKFKRDGITDWLDQANRRDKVTSSTRRESYRCGQAICDFADALYPDLPSTKSMVESLPDSEAVIIVPRAELASYVAVRGAQILTYNRAANTMGLPARNFGEVKGLSFDHVVIIATGKIRKYLKTRNPADAGDRAKFYVAVTRARSTVAFVVD